MGYGLQVTAPIEAGREDEAQQNGNAVNITKQEYDTFETPYIKLQIQEKTLEHSDFKAVMCARHHLMHKMKHTPQKYASYLQYSIRIKRLHT